MGSYAYTCSVSSLPIEAGTPVRFFPLSQNPYRSRGPTTGISARWGLRTFPVKAKYNDYGSVRDLEPGLLRDIMFESFQKDAVERGVGDNTCHDVAVLKTMGVEDWLRALSEGRVLVRGSYDAHDEKITGEALKEKYGSTAIHPSIPTRRRVESALKKAGLKLSRGGFAEGYLVDRISFGYQRVRYEGGPWRGEAVALAVAEKALSSFATMLTAGTGSSADSAELLVAPKAWYYDKTREEADLDALVNRLVRLKDDESILGLSGLRKRKRSGREKNLAVEQAMVREDVWQALLKLTPKEDSAFATYHADVREVWAEDQETRSNDAERTFASIERVTKLGSNRVAERIFHLTGLPGFRLQDAWNMAAEREPKGAELNAFLDTVAETVFVESVLSSLRFQWRPGSSAGPQFGDFVLHHDYHDALRRISRGASLKSL